ncbi:MAG: SDR family NAD(P)-dependent oxidoreductase, partial [Planctomycetia bacterium]|nr:SDR family NAD(P)-dependent oxidoreductase [Planctomycetia bacterium]
MLSRNTSTPASTRRWMASSARDAGPSVATTFVRTISRDSDVEVGMADFSAGKGGEGPAGRGSYHAGSAPWRAGGGRLRGFDRFRERRGMTWQARRVIVAGGTAGFGLVLARHLALAGARVAIVGRSAEGVRRGLEACERAGAPSANLAGVAADLGGAGEGSRVAGETLRLLGGIDDLFFCV